MNDNDASTSKARFPTGDVIVTDEQATDDGGTLHFMRLSPELEALIRAMAEDVRALRQGPAMPALLALAEAVGRLANNPAPWWAIAGVSGRWVCVGCAGQSGAEHARIEINHFSGCAALAIDAALADLAALDGGGDEATS